MKITRLQAGAKDPSRCNIYVDGQFLLAIPAEGVVEYHLKVGMDVDSSLLDELSLYDEEKKALRLGLELLSRRPHSKWELVQKMTAKGISKEVAQLGCQRLSEQGYLDEEAFAQAYGEHLRQKGLGLARIRDGLRQKGVEASLASQVAEELCQEGSGEEIRAFIEKKLRFQRANDARLKKRIMDGLLRHGFGYDECRPILEEYFEPYMEEEEPWQSM